MKHVIFLLAFIVIPIAGCSTDNTKNDLKNAEKTWISKISAEIPIGTNMEEVTKWFESKGYTPQPDILGSMNTYTVLLNSFEADEWYCDKWTIYVKIDITNEKKVSEYHVSSLGYCL